MALTDISKLDLYFFVKPAADTIAGKAALLDAVVAPKLGADWAKTLVSDAAAYRAAVETLIRETTETTGALRLVDQLTANVSQWRALAVGLARNAPAPRQEVLLKAAGYGLGTPRTVKEMKDVLLTIKSRFTTLSGEFATLGMAPALQALPGRVLAKLEGGAADVAREKAEDALARSQVNELAGRVTTALEAAMDGAGLVSMQALLLSQDEESSAEARRAELTRASEADALAVHLEKALGEARVLSRKRAAEDVLPPGLVTEEPAPTTSEQPAA